MRGVRLAGVAAARPALELSNDDLVTRGLDTTDKWVRTRTGIERRGVAAEDEGVVELATAAAQKALAVAGCDPAATDLVIVASCTMPTPVPIAAAQVAATLGATGGAFDLNAACAGFCYSLTVAADAIRTGRAEQVVVVGAERFSTWLDWTDRSTAIIFADGAGAAVLRAHPDADDVSPVVWGSDGAGADLIRIPPEDGHLRMEGAAVYRWATTALAPIAAAACEKAGIAVGELAAFVPHQANLRIVDALAKALHVDESVTAVARDIVTAGNTSAASIPMALARLQEEGRVRSGDPALLFGFGAGLTYAAQVVRCP